MQKASRPQRIAFRDNYLAALSVVALVLCSLVGQGQIFINPPGTYGTGFHRSYHDSALYFPTGCGVPSGIASLHSVGFGNGEKKRMAAIYADTCGHKSYWFDWSDSTWLELGGSGSSTDTTSLDARIKLKLDSLTQSADTTYYWTNGTRHFGFTGQISLANLLATLGYTPLAPTDTLSDGFLQTKYDDDTAHARINAALDKRIIDYFGDVLGVQVNTIDNRPDYADNIGTLYLAKENSISLAMDTGWVTMATVGGSGGIDSSLAATKYGLDTSSTAIRSEVDSAKVNIRAGIKQADWTQATTTDASYIKNKPTLGTAAALNVAASGNATATEVVKGDDSRLTDSIRRSKDSVYTYHSGTKTLEYIDSLSPWPDPAPMGIIYKKNNWTAQNLAQDIVANASGGTASSLTLNTAGQIVSTASATSFNNYNLILPGRPSMVDHFSMKIDFVLTAYGYGFATTMHSINSGITAFMATNSGGSLLYIANKDGSTFYVSSVAGPTNVLGHTYETILTLNDSTITFSAQDSTTQGTVYTATYQLPAADIRSPSMGNFGFFSFAGTHIVDNIEIKSTATRNANWLFAGDSKTREKSPTSWAGRYAAQVGANVGTYNVYAASGLTVANMLTLYDEILALNPRNVLLNIGSNDLRTSVSLPKLESDYAKLTELLQAGGAKVYHIVLPEDSTGGTPGSGIGMTAFKNWVAVTYPDTYIDVWTGMSTSNVLNTGYNSGDGIHPNQAGNDYIATTLIATGIFVPRDTTVRSSPYTTNDRNVVMQGHNVRLAFPIVKRVNYIPKWNADYSLGFGVLQDNGLQAGAAIGLPLIPFGSSAFTVNGTMGINTSSGRITFSDQGGSNTTPNFSLMSSNKRIIIYSDLYSKDALRMDTIGRLQINVIKNTLFGNSFPTAYIHIGGSNGNAGNAPLKLDSGVIMATPEKYAIETDGINILHTDRTGTRDTLAKRGWVRQAAHDTADALRTELAGASSVNNVIVASATSTASTSSTNYLTYTTGSGDSVYRVGCGLNLLVNSGNTVQMEVSWTDEANTSQTAVFAPQGAATGAITASSGSYPYPTLDIRVKGGTTITMRLNETATVAALNFNCYGSITKLF